MARFDNLKLASVGRRGASAKVEAIKAAVKLLNLEGLRLVRIRTSVELLGEFVNRFFPPFEFFPMILLSFQSLATGRCCWRWSEVVPCGIKSLSYHRKKMARKLLPTGKKYPLRYGNSNSVAYILLIKIVFKAATVSVPFFRRNILLRQEI